MVKIETAAKLPRTKKFSPKKSTKNNPEEVKSISVIPSNIELLNKFKNHCENRGLTNKTVKTYDEFNTRFINYIQNKFQIQDIRKVDADVIELYIEYLNKERNVSKITINSTIRNVKPFFNSSLKL